jgi:hypothetical protein
VQVAGVRWTAKNAVWRIALIDRHLHPSGAAGTPRAYYRATRRRTEFMAEPSLATDCEGAVAKEELIMSARFRNKLLTVCIAIAASLVLVGTTVALEVLALAGKIGWLVKTLPLLIAIPAVLFGYESICEWWYHRFITGENRKLLVQGSQQCQPTRYRRDAWRPFVNESARSEKQTNGSRKTIQTTTVILIPTRGFASSSQRARMTASAKRWIGQ